MVGCAVATSKAEETDQWSELPWFYPYISALVQILLPQILVPSGTAHSDYLGLRIAVLRPLAAVAEPDEFGEIGARLGRLQDGERLGQHGQGLG